MCSISIEILVLNLYYFSCVIVDANARESERDSCHLRLMEKTWITYDFLALAQKDVMHLKIRTTRISVLRFEFYVSHAL